MKISLKKTSLLSLTLGLLAIHPLQVLSEPKVIDYDYRIVKEYPHSTTMFTQGLEIHQGKLYESSGLRGYSKIQTRSLTSSKPTQQVKLEKKYFGEGITLLNNKIYQLTWQSNKGFIYLAENLSRVTSFNIKGQGWGITNNGQQLIYSDGSDKLRFLNPKNFQIEKILSVKSNNHPVTKLNELEWVDGLIYANIWQSDWIMIIDPVSGQVIGRVNLEKLLAKKLRTRNTDVLNGIAYDKATQQLFVTGKNWPLLYEIQLIKPSK